ncbi:MAG: hypothetical protein A2521_13470 [Deltaproteobacteria bacterium RIFOXYD12_FULL_57_12]|nr:MAG: hypothetical protein A2521_13470 [Deltaproteobacteria bacterium RIFOXYD12_FULL_57_12]
MLELTQKEFDGLRIYIRNICGVAIPDTKSYLVQQRLEPLVKASGSSTFTEFYQKVISDRGSLYRDSLITAITTNETFFFRDGHPFVAFEKTVLPMLGALIKQKKAKGGVLKRPLVRIWCAASSTGQEPYTLAMLVYEYARANAFQNIDVEDFGILASDISPPVLLKAKAGEFTEAELARGLSVERKKKYFTRLGEVWKIHDYLRTLVEYRRVNLIEAFGFLGTFEVVFCRNVLIYFNLETKRKIIEKFRAVLTEPGILFLGSSENLYGLSDGFDSQQTGLTVYYRKKGVSAC